ncbi:2-phospho-L-lactate guanylyltransferase [Xanthobacter sp. KR7-225]|uniref:2-phospho-L-lactate guanylyltransferase n=1 Tax=Xanthobacter sp. KR7-225 TaxID=3156613 RepID=UPI0032B4DECC
MPVKRFAAAKQRLSGLLDADGRAALARAMLDDLLALLCGDAGLAGTLVVGEEPEARVLCRRHGAAFLSVPDQVGLNGAIARGEQDLAARGASAMLVVPSDLPGLTRADLDALRRALATCDVALVAAERDGGTNLLASPLPLAFAPSYGPASFARHRAAATAAGLTVGEPDCPGGRTDLDRPEDLAALGTCGLRTRAVLPHLKRDIRPRAARPALTPIAAG